jgi:hypothetical protein
VDEQLLRRALRRHTALVDAPRSLDGTRAVDPETSAELGMKLLFGKMFQAVLHRQLRFGALISWAGSQWLRLFLRACERIHEVVLPVLPSPWFPPRCNFLLLLPDPVSWRCGYMVTFATSPRTGADPGKSLGMARVWTLH